MGLLWAASTNNEWPSGLAHIVVTGLMKRFRPLDTVSRVELRHKMNQVAMKKDKNPLTLFEQLSAIENQHRMPGMKVDEEEKIAIVIDAAPHEYQALISSKRSNKGGSLTLMDLKVVMCSH